MIAQLQMTSNDDLRDLVPEWVKKGLDGIQLNQVWPDPVSLSNFCEDNPELFIVFQYSKGAHGAMPETRPFECAAEILGTYPDAVKYVLFDFSGGLGVDLNLELATEFYTTITDALPVEVRLPFM